MIDAPAILRQLADEIRARAEFQRRMAGQAEQRARDYRELGDVLDAVAVKIADGEIDGPATIKDAIEAARGPSPLGRDREGEVDRLRRSFGIAPGGAA